MSNNNDKQHTPKAYNLRSSKKNALNDNSDTDSDNDSCYEPNNNDNFYRILYDIFPSKYTNNKKNAYNNNQLDVIVNLDNNVYTEDDDDDGDDSDDSSYNPYDDDEYNNESYDDDSCSDNDIIDNKQNVKNIKQNMFNKLVNNTTKKHKHNTIKKHKHRNNKKIKNKHKVKHDINNNDDGDDDEWLMAIAEEESRIINEMKNKNKNKNKDKPTKTNKSPKSNNYTIGDKVLVKDPEWDKPYPGIILKKYPNNSSNISKTYYDIRLNDDDYEILKHIPYKWVITPKQKINDGKDVLKELDNYIKLYTGKNKNILIKEFNKLSKANNKREQDELNRLEKIEKDKNNKSLYKLLNNNKLTNDFNYFKKLPIIEQNEILKKLEDINEYDDNDKPYRITLINSDIPTQFKSAALKKINSLQYMDNSSGEYYRLKQWVDTFMRIPFNKYNQLDIKLSDGMDKCKIFMENAKNILDNAVYGLDDAKMQIMQCIGKWISNPNSLGTAIAIKGPPGTGKTTLIKEGISKILNRPFEFLALGGATDSSFLEGHSYTYEGSLWGKIVDILLNSKCMNPVIYFDELDKVSNTPKGEEIIGILTHLTDTTQNDKFHDKYFSSIDFNLSKAMFIFSYNDESKINPILKDRMYRIETKGYDNKQKQIIAQKYLIPKIEKSISFDKGNVIILEETIEYICNNLTEKEKGVRNLKRALEIIYSKINLYKLLDNDSTVFNNEQAFKITFPFTVTKDIVNKLIKKQDTDIPMNMYI